MRPFCTLVLMDLVRWLRSPTEMLSVLGIPFVLIAAIGLVFGGVGGSGPAPTLHVCIVDNDDDLLGQLLRGVSSQEKTDNKLQVHAGTLEESLKMIENDRASAVIVLPEGLTESILDGEPTTVEVIPNPRQMILPHIVTHGMNMAADVLTAGSYVFSDSFKAVRSFRDRESAPQEWEVLGMTASMYRSIRAAETVFEPLVLWTDEWEEDESEGTAGATVPESERVESGRQFNIFDEILPRISLFALLMGASAAVAELLRKQRDGRLQRTAVCPLSSRMLLLASMSGTLLLTAMAQMFMVVLGILVFDVSWGNLFGVALVVLAGALACTGLFATVAGLCTSERQYGTVSSIAVMAMAMLGGSMVPMEQLPAVMSTLGKSTFNYWMIEGFKILQDGGGLGDVMGITAGLLTTGVAISAAGSLLLSRSLASGRVVQE